jgi:di/tricarboxylate transporter
LFVTSLLIPFLVVILRVMRDENTEQRLDAKSATKMVFAAMWTPVIMLLLGGFTIAAALSKYHIAKLMATFVLSKAGNKPKVVLLTNMFVAMVLSMWISNVAAPVLCFSIIQVCSLLMIPSKTDWLASSTKFGHRVKLSQSSHLGYCPCIKYWRRCISYSIATKHYCP